MTLLLLLLFACGGPSGDAPELLPVKKQKKAVVVEAVNDTGDAKRGGEPHVVRMSMRQEALHDEIHETQRDASSLKHYLQDKRAMERGGAPVGWKQPPMAVYEEDPRSHIPKS